MKRIPVYAVLLAGLALAACTRDLPVGDTEKALFLPAAVFEGFGFEIGDTAQRESYKKMRYFDGSYELEYEFEAPDESPDYIYVYSSLSVERKASDAMTVYLAMDVGFRIGNMAAGDVDIVEDNEFYQYGDASKFKRIVHEGRQIGNMFITRSGKRVYFVVVSGTYFDDAQLWGEVIGERLAAFEQYEP